MSLKDAAEELSKKWGISIEEAEKEVKKFMAKKPVDRSKAMPSKDNPFAEPLGPLSTQVQDASQAVLSTAFMRKSLKEMNQPPEELERLKGDVESVKDQVNEMLGLINTTVKEMKETLEAKQAEEQREKLIKELEDRVIQPLKDELENVKEKVEEAEKAEGEGKSVEVKESIKGLRQRVREAESEAREVLGELGYDMPDKEERQRESIKDLKTKVKEAEEEAKGVLEELGYTVQGKIPVQATPEEKTTEELIDFLKGKGYRVEYDMIRREKALELAKEAQRRAQEEFLDDKRIDAVAGIVQTAVDRIFDMFTEPLQMWMNNAMTSRGPAGGAEESRQEEP